MFSILNESDFITTGTTVVKFWAAWCGPCKKISPLLDKLEPEFPTIKFLSVDIEQVPTLAKKYKVKMLPTIVILKNGREINRVNGLVLTEPLRKAFKDAIKDDPSDS